MTFRFRRQRPAAAALAAGVLLCAAAPLPAGEVWMAHRSTESDEFYIDHKDGLTLYCREGAGTIRTTIDGVYPAPVEFRAGAATVSMAGPSADATHTRGTLAADSAVFAAYVETGELLGADKRFVLGNAGDRDVVVSFLGFCKESDQ